MIYTNDTRICPTNHVSSPLMTRLTCVQHRSTKASR
ncbi:hypothetical protein E2C01_096718 [Portunus trituberculatus]|uniref:Uncharacterized protein n=1 Tax=Portunus trituberculatus TaxID=210409 RepID=A0A5B7K2H6_PORTR|nr:hypothetical protein [Portunus trituberculatus]